MDGQNTTSNTILSSPPPFDVELSAPLAQPDDDFGMSLSTAGTPNTPADDTGSTVSPVSPVHLNRQKLHAAATVSDDEHQPTTDGNVAMLPPPPLLDHQQYVPLQDDGTTETVGENDGKAEDDDQVPVLTMSGNADPAVGGQVDPKKSNASGEDNNSATAAGERGNHNSKDKSRYMSGNSNGTDADDSGRNNPQVSLGCGTTFEYVILMTACTILLLSVTGTTVYWVMAYRDGFDSKWFPWPPQTPKQLMSVGVFTYMHSKNFTTEADEALMTTKSTALDHQQQSNIGSSSNILTEDRRFNLHPTLMTAGFITLTGFSILVYRMAAGCSTSCRGTYVKLTHSLLHLATVPCVFFGGVAAMEYHRLKGLPHLYSLHSWMGMLTISLFIIQFTLGLFTFVVLLCCRGATAACRLKCFAPIHATLGLCTFTLAIATGLTGLQQRADFTIFNNNGTEGNPTISELVKQKLHLNKEPVVVNVLAVLLVSVLVVVSYTIRRESIKRRPNNKSSYTATVSPLRVKSSTAKFGSGKQSSQPPV